MGGGGATVACYNIGCAVTFLLTFAGIESHVLYCAELCICLCRVIHTQRERETIRCCCYWCCCYCYCCCCCFFLAGLIQCRGIPRRQVYKLARRDLLVLRSSLDFGDAGILINIVCVFVFVFADHYYNGSVYGRMTLDATHHKKQKGARPAFSFSPELVRVLDGS